MRYFLTTCLLTLSLTSAADVPLDGPASPAGYLTRLDDYTHLERIDPIEERFVRDYLVPLGAIEKIRGQWAPRDSERHTGTLTRYTWRVLDGYESSSVVSEMDEILAGDTRAELIFSCEARGCGSSVQWANRIFQQRLLYGTEGSQRYRVYAFSEGDSSHRLLLYASSRTSDRQYLHGELLSLESESESE